MAFPARVTVIGEAAPSIDNLADFKNLLLMPWALSGIMLTHKIFGVIKIQHENQVKYSLEPRIMIIVV